MKKTKTNISVVNNAGIRRDISVHVGDTGPYSSGDILDANAVLELIESKLNPKQLDSEFTLKPGLTDINEILRYIEEWSNTDPESILQSILLNNPSYKEMYDESTTEEKEQLLERLSILEISSGVLSNENVPIKNIANTTDGFDYLDVLYNSKVYTYDVKYGEVSSRNANEYDYLDYTTPIKIDNYFVYFTDKNIGAENSTDVGTQYELDYFGYTDPENGEFVFNDDTFWKEILPTDDEIKWLGHNNLEPILTNGELTGVKFTDSDGNEILMPTSFWIYMAYADYVKECTFYINEDTGGLTMDFRDGPGSIRPIRRTTLDIYSDI